MTDHGGVSGVTEQGTFNPAPVGRRILARSVRLARAGGARFAAQTAARHRNPTRGRGPRLLPVRDVRPPDGRGRAPSLPPEQAVAEQPVAEPAVAVPRPGGISDEAARWLFLGELGPSMLPMSALKPAPPPAARKVARSTVPRPRIEEGPSVRPASPRASLARSPERPQRRVEEPRESDRGVHGDPSPSLGATAEAGGDGRDEGPSDASPGSDSVARGPETAPTARSGVMRHETPAQAGGTRSLARASTPLLRRSPSPPAMRPSPLGRVSPRSTATPATPATIEATQSAPAAIARAPRSDTVETNPAVDTDETTPSPRQC